MRYLLFLGIGIVLMPLILLSLQYLTGWGIAASSNFNLLLHWFVFTAFTGIIPLICKYFLNTIALRISFVITIFSWLMTLILIWIFYHQITEDLTGWMLLEMNYIYINLFYLISILFCFTVKKRIRSQKE